MNSISEAFEKIIADIDSSTPQMVERRAISETFQLSGEPFLLSNLSGNVGALIVRALLHQLGVDEHYVLKWRLEHKYRQYQILNHYLPPCMPESFSLSQILGETDGAEKARALCANGYFIKSSLGDSSGRKKNFDRTAELEEIIISRSNHIDEDDKWILQKRLNIIKEFRVHTFQKDVLYGLTLPMTDLDSSYVSEIDEVLKPVLDRLPESILAGTLIGWDIAITDNYKTYIIEANFTGYHTEYYPGFHTSGFFGDLYCGSMMCAWLNNYFRNKFNISIGSVDETLILSTDFYREFMFYSQLFNNEQWFHLKKSRNGDPSSAILYLGEDINCLTTKLLDFFQIGSFAKKYYLIVQSEYFFSVKSLLSLNELIKVIGEHELFSGEDLEEIKHLDYESREKECCELLKRRLTKEVCFIVR